MWLEYKRFIDAAQIPESYMQQLFNLEVQVWWQEPFWEYKICDNEECRRIFSIKQVHWLSHEHDISRWDTFCCSECSSSTSYLYKSEEFYALMHEYVKNNVSMILLVWEGDVVEWFWILSQWTIGSVANFEFQTRPWWLLWEEIVENLSQRLFEKPDAGDEPIVCFHQIYLSEHVRDAAMSYKLLQELFFLVADVYQDLPVVWETLYNGRFYPVSRSLWFQDSVHDKYWYVIQYIEKYSDILRFLWENDGFQDFQKDLVRYRRHWKAISVAEKLWWERYYKPE